MDIRHELIIDFDSIFHDEVDVCVYNPFPDEITKLVPKGEISTNYLGFGEFFFGVGASKVPVNAGAVTHFR